jgi:Gluconate 2-dehydrogenase subunit 3
MIAVLTGGAFIGGGVLTGCRADDKLGGVTFSNEDILFLDEVAETILPATKTPGAKAAKAGELIKVMVNDTYEVKDQQIFHKGIAALNEVSKKNGQSFTDAIPKERTALLSILDKEANAYEKSKKKGEPSHYFTMMKQLTLFGFFSFKEGATQALRYIGVPGKYVGDIPYKKADKAWLPDSVQLKLLYNSR